MATKKYKHIKLPKQLFSNENKYNPPPKKYFPPENIFDRKKHKKRLVNNIDKIKKFYDERKNELLLEDDKGNNEIKITFKGAVKEDFIDKYGIEIYKIRESSKKNQIIYGKINNLKLPEQEYSQFERLQRDILAYKNSEKDRGKTYFDWIKEIKPLTIKEIVEPEFLEELKKNRNSEYYIDISFVGDQSAVEIKIDKIFEQFKDRFIFKINHEILHYCRIKAKFKDVEKTISKFKGISYVEKSPKYFLETSKIKEEMSEVKVISPDPSLTPVIVYDTDVNQNHLCIKGAIEDSLYNDGSDLCHGTAVASLVICGTNIKKKGEIIQDNKIISIKVSQNNFTSLDKIIEETIEKYSKKYKLLIANLSSNFTYIIYDRKKTVNNLTVLLDILANKYNCIFVISAGNLFNENWGEDLIRRCLYLKGYPNYFNEQCTRILPPADSINNISVGSITYQQSVDSLIKIKNPTLHTRGNFDSFPFIKPDFVNFDSNYRQDFSCEENGVYMAKEESNLLTSMTGTSFAAPLVAHDLALLHNKYPNLTNNSIKGLLIHFAKNNIGNEIASKKIRERLIGNGLPCIEDALYSNNNSSTIIIEDSITVGEEKAGKKKVIKFPIPSCLAGSHNKRLRIRKTLIYNPIVNIKNINLYNPIFLSAQIIRSDGKNVAGKNTNNTYDGAHQKSNVHKYPPIERSTKDYMGNFWKMEVVCLNKDQKVISPQYKQNYSIIITIEDMDKDDNIDLHEEILNMIKIETHVSVPVEIVSET